MVQKRILVTRAPGEQSKGLVHLSNGVRPCALGGSGLGVLKREGDGLTPLGVFPLRQLLYRDDRVMRPRTLIPVHAIRASDGWSDDSDDRNYNRMIALPSPRSAETLKREDHLYDLVLVMGYNDCPRVRGRGSAVFIHLARPEYTPTEGCIALSKRDFLALLREVGPGTRIEVRG
ncbi:L,D-transpeptidase catalytic domain [Methyloligella halotolerans]|uniref:L,D-transpeptidase catalytic domain n=1 Tax=Methyloligella halotolerans TaxID=1177755 RepID=A0A1E2S114_9HYPH|nr:L,D-transpeptidase family protein [Methyloligella halotolerans]ODA68015.1 L,D-transpeptidase catalytic domain [Methyloligella halotolerans]